MMNKTIVPQRGFNIVELMISITIGLVMIVFVTSLYVRSKGTYEVNDDSSRMQQEARLIMSLIGRNLTQAGFAQPPYTINKGVLVSEVRVQALRVCDGGFATPTDLTATACNGGAGAPGFEVSYMVENAVNVNTGAGTDCNGQQAPMIGVNRVVVNRFYLSGAAGNRSLNCLGNGGPVAQPLLSNVENMRLRFGVMGNPQKRVDGFYNTAAEVLTLEGSLGIDPPPPNFSRVASVEVCLQLTSATRTNKKNEQRFVDCDGNTVTPTDGLIHMSMTSVFTLRNNSDTTLVDYN